MVDTDTNMPSDDDIGVDNPVDKEIKSSSESVDGVPEFEIEAPQATTQVKSDEEKQIATDAKGQVFDPELHRSPDKFNKDGTFRRKRNSKKPKKISSGSENVSSTLSFDDGEPADYGPTADAICNMYIALHMPIFGENVALPRTITKPFRDSIAYMMEEEGIEKLPTKVLVVINGLGVTTAIASKEGNQGKLTKFFKKLMFWKKKDDE